MKLLLSSFVIICLLGSCLSPPSYPVEPKIEFLSISRTILNQRTSTGTLDSIRVEFSFQDGDGDIGFEPFSSANCNPCSDSCLSHPTRSIFIYDNRTGCLSPFNVPYVPPKGSSDAISGKINVVISSVCCILPTGFACIPSTQYPTDTVIFSIQMKDRAGHLSNIIELPPVIVNCN